VFVGDERAVVDHGRQEFRVLDRAVVGDVAAVENQFLVFVVVDSHLFQPLLHFHPTDGAVAIRVDLFE